MRKSADKISEESKGNEANPDAKGPIVMVVGPNNSGKSTLCR